MVICDRCRSTRDAKPFALLASKGDARTNQPDPIASCDLCEGCRRRVLGAIKAALLPLPEAAPKRDAG